MLRASRRSRRISDLEPKVCDDIPSAPTRELKNLLAKGGLKGRINSKNSDWNFHPTRIKRTTSMISVSELKNDISKIQEYNKKEEDKESFPSNYLLLHVNQMKSGTNFNCNTCKRKEKSVSNKINISTYGMASAINLTCSECKATTEFPPEKSSFAGKGYDGLPSNRQNNLWYEANLRLVLGTLAIGNGGSDLSDFSAILDLPQASSFGYRPFNRIESNIGENLREIAEQAMKEALDEEIKLTLEEQGIDFKQWQEKTIQEKEQVLLTVSFDTGWQKRLSGNKYDSLSGHAFMIGARSRKIIQCVVSSKMCATCLDSEESKNEPKSHVCPRQYTGSSKAMESDAALEAYENLFELKKGIVAINFIIAAEDSSMRSYLKHRPSSHTKETLPSRLPPPE